MNRDAFIPLQEELTKVLEETYKKYSLLHSNKLTIQDIATATAVALHRSLIGTTPEDISCEITHLIMEEIISIHLKLHEIHQEKAKYN